MSNADLDHRDKKYSNRPIGSGVDVVTGEIHNMIEIGIIDPLLVTKTALKNAVSVVSTIVSADAVISNIRIE